MARKRKAANLVHDPWRPLCGASGTAGRGSLSVTRAFANPPARPTRRVLGADAQAGGEWQGDHAEQGHCEKALCSEARVERAGGQREHCRGGGVAECVHGLGGGGEVRRRDGADRPHAGEVQEGEGEAVQRLHQHEACQRRGLRHGGGAVEASLGWAAELRPGPRAPTVDARR